MLCSSSSYSVSIRCCPLSRDSRIYSISSAIAHTLSLHLSCLRASSFFIPIFSVSTSRSSLVVLAFSCHLTSRFRPTLKTLLSSLLSTCPYHLTSFAVANRYIVSFNPLHVHLFFSCLPVNNFLTAHGSHHSSLHSP